MNSHEIALTCQSRQLGLPVKSVPPFEKGGTGGIYTIDQTEHTLEIYYKRSIYTIFHLIDTLKWPVLTGSTSSNIHPDHSITI